MKHCPNPECSGIANFNIVSEFNDTATECSDCGTRLVSGPAPSPEELRGETEPEPDPDLELVPVFIANDEADLMVVEGVLEQAKIPYLAKGEQIQDLFGFGRLVAVNPITGPVEIYVSADHAETARELLAEALE